MPPTDSTTTRDILVPREIVFDLFTQREHLSNWYVAGEVPDPAQYTDVDPPARFSYTADGRSVAVTLHEIGDTTRIEIKEPEADLAWAERLDSLIEYLSSI